MSVSYLVCVDRLRTTGELYERVGPLGVWETAPLEEEMELGSPVHLNKSHRSVVSRGYLREENHETQRQRCSVGKVF